MPYSKKVTDYETQEWTEMVPKQRVITEYQENRWVESVPREVKTVDYMAIEHVKQYVPEVTQESVMETIPIERTIQRTEYIPVERYNHN